MQALLGKIVSITKKDEPAGSRFEIGFKATCTLPKRTTVPEWLKDQVLKIEREVADPREIGDPGDSIVLLPDESAKWLYPLTVTPAIAYGRLPESIHLSMAWRKGDSAPDYTVRANGKQITGKFTKEGDEYFADVSTSAFYDSDPKLPVQFEVTCDKLKTTCDVLPEGEPFWRRLLPPQGEIHRVENDWYSVDFEAKSFAGGIAALREKGRGVDHFRNLENRIQRPLQNSGHTDRLRRGWGWWGKLGDCAMTSASARREDNATHLHLDGVADEGENVRASVAYTLYDQLPLLLWRRDFSFHTGKKKEDDSKGKEEAVKEPIDELSPVSLGFRAAWIPERNGSSGSRVLCADKDRVLTVRCAGIDDAIYAENWRMSQGWAMVEHPKRRDYSMYLFNEQDLPHLVTWLTADCFTLEPMWIHTIVKPGDSIGYTLGLAAGELCGASENGAWVACRTVLTGGGVRCAVIARVKSDLDNSSVEFRLGDQVREASLEKVLMPGLGRVSYALAEFAGARMEDEFDVTAAGIASRRMQ